MKLANIDLKGLNTYASHRSVQENYLLDCNNVVCDKAGVISTRRGFSFFDDALVNCKKIFSAIQNIFVNADSKLYYDGGAGTFTQVTFPNTSTIDANDSTQKIQIEDQNKSLYFNGKRVSSETNNPIDKKIKKLSAVSSNVINAGLEAPINLSLELTTDTGQIPANSSFALRVFCQYTDENDFLITSPVSDRVIGINDTGSAKNFILTYQIPNQLMDRVVGIYYAISNTTTNPVTPDDNLFWSKDTLMQGNAYINNGLASVFTFANILTRDALINPVDLYTNSTQQGILQNNNPPVSSVDLETYQGYTFYGNLIDRLQKRLFAVEFPMNTNIITIDGITYKRTAASDYSASPVEFSGSNVKNSTIDLCRAITATQTKYRAVFEQDNDTDINVWTDKAVFPGTTYEHNQSCTDGTLIYNLDVNSNLYSYNPVTNVWTFLIDITNAGSYQTMQYYNGKIYFVLGVYGGNAPTYIYDIATNTVTTGTAFTALADTQATSVIYNDKIYCFIYSINFGGASSKKTYEYDITNDAWTAKTDITDTRLYPAVAISGDKAYIIGGINAVNVPQNSIYEYDITNDTWTTKTAPGYARVAGSAAYYQGYVYYVGGFTGTPSVFSNPTATFYRYSVGGDAWEALTSANYATGFSGCNIVGDALYLTGGFLNPGIPAASQKYKIDGFYLQLQERFIGEETDITYTSSYISDYNFEWTDSALYRFEQKNTVQFSKQGQPEAVPFFNNFQCGSASYDILRLSALRSSLMILKTDGIYQLNGVSPETFSVQQLDPTFVLIAPQSLAKLNNEIYCLTNKGVVAINESGAKIISYPIKDLIDYDVAQVANLKTDINGTAYEDDYRYILTINDKTYTYNYVSDQWTIWFSGKSDIASWTVFNSNLYYLDSTRAYRERKTLTSADFQDENNAGIDASIKFNNLELNPGNMMDVIAMQILQRTQSNLTASITPDNNFNSGTLFTQLLDKFIVRVMFPNECRKAFYFRPLIQWNTEVAATPGTFSDLQLEGLDFDYDETASNIK